MRIEDKDVQGVLVEHDEEWYLRVQSPSILEDYKDRNYLWYAMTAWGWRWQREERTAELEAAYTSALGAPKQ